MRSSIITSFLLTSLAAFSLAANTNRDSTGNIADKVASLKESNNNNDYNQHDVDQRLKVIKEEADKNKVKLPILQDGDSKDSKDAKGSKDSKDKPDMQGMPMDKGFNKDESVGKRVESIKAEIAKEGLLPN